MQDRLVGVEKITFGIHGTNRQNTATGILTVPSLSCLAYHWLDNPTFLAILVPSSLVALSALLCCAYRNQLIINFTQGVYYQESGLWPAVKVSGGLLRDISHISITQDKYLQSSETPYATYIEFVPEIKRAPYPLDNAPCSVRIGDFRDRVALYVGLAARLNVPIQDDSGWNGRQPRIREPEMIVIPPGETHPVLLQEPPKWNKW